MQLISDTIRGKVISKAESTQGDHTITDISMKNLLQVMLVCMLYVCVCVDNVDAVTVGGIWISHGRNIRSRQIMKKELRKLGELLQLKKFKFDRKLFKSVRKPYS